MFIIREIWVPLRVKHVAKCKMNVCGGYIHNYFHIVTTDLFLYVFLKNRHNKNYNFHCRLSDSHKYYFQREIT